MILETEEPARANVAGDGLRHGARGMLGGDDGAPHDYRMQAPGAAEEKLPSKVEGQFVPPGTVFEIHSGGGGGWGTPSDREGDARQSDVGNGLVTTSDVRGA